MLEKPFKFPDFKKDFLDDDNITFDETDDAKEYLELVKQELDLAADKKEGAVKRRYYEQTVNWVHHILEDAQMKKIDEAAALYRNARGLVQGASEGKTPYYLEQSVKDLVNRTGIPGGVWEAWTYLNMMHCQTVQTHGDYDLPNPIAEYVKDSEKTFLEGGFIRWALGGGSTLKDSLAPKYRQMMDKKELKNEAEQQKENAKMKVYEGLRSTFRQKPETLKICMEIISLNAKDRVDKENYVILADKFLDYLKLAYEKDLENQKWNKRPERDDDLEMYEPDGVKLKEYEEELEKRKTQVKKPLRFKPKVRRAAVAEGQ